MGHCHNERSRVVERTALTWELEVILIPPPSCSESACGRARYESEPCREPACRRGLAPKDEYTGVWWSDCGVPQRSQWHAAPNQSVPDPSDTNAAAYAY